MTGADLKVGSRVWGRTILSLRRMQVPALVLHESVARAHPQGLPAWDATITSPYTKSGTIGVTIFHNDYFPETT